MSVVLLLPEGSSAEDETLFRRTAAWLACAMGSVPEVSVRNMPFTVEEDPSDCPSVGS